MTEDQSRPKGLSTLPTSEVVLAPEFLDGVKKIAPRKTRSKLWIVLLLAIAGAGGFFAWKRMSLRARAVEVSSATSDTAPPTASAAASTTANGGVEPLSPNASASVTSTASVMASANASASASAAPSPKIKVRRRGPATR